MCVLKTWYSGADGAVRQCEDCDHFQVIFGTTMLTLSEDEFSTFVQLVGDSFLTPGAGNVRSVVLPTPSSTVNLILSGRELGALNALLQHADNERAAASLLELFRVDDPI